MKFASFLPFFRMRMGLFHCLSQPLPRHMGIDLGRREVFMPKQFLHNAQIGPVIQKMRRKGMTDHMGMNMYG